MYTGKPTTDKGLIVRLILAFLCLTACVFQIYAGIRLIQSNTVPPRDVTGADLSRLTVGEEVTGTVDNIVMEYVGDNVLNEVQVSYYISKTNDGRLISYRVETGTDMDHIFSDMAKGYSNEISYRGAVHQMTDITRGLLNMQLIAGNVLQNKGISSGTQQAMLPYIIDVVPESAKIDDRYIIFTFIGAVLMLVLALVILRKPIKNLRESMQSRKGEYVPDLQVRKEDLVFENEGYYEGMKEGETEFYVNTEYNIRGEGDTGLIREKEEAESTHEGDDAPKPMKYDALPPEDFFYQDKGPDEDGQFYTGEIDSRENRKGYRRY